MEVFEENKEKEKLYKTDENKSDNYNKRRKRSRRKSIEVLDR